jgi:hypothetical protein
MRQVSTSPAISDVLETLSYSTIAAPHPHYTSAHYYTQRHLRGRVPALPREPPIVSRSARALGGRRILRSSWRQERDHSTMRVSSRHESLSRTLSMAPARYAPSFTMSHPAMSQPLIPS